MTAPILERVPVTPKTHRLADGWTIEYGEDIFEKPSQETIDALSKDLTKMLIKEIAG